MGIAFLDPVDVTEPWEQGWQSYDVSALVSESAKGAALRVVNESSKDRKWGLRPSGSSDSLEDDLDSRAHTWDFVGLDSSMTFEAYRESSAIKLELVGEFSGSATFLGQAVNLTPGSVPVGSYQSYDIGGHTGGVTATAAIILFLGPPVAVFARRGGSSLDLPGLMDERLPVIVPLDANQTFEARVGDGSCNIWLLGFDSQGYVWTEGSDITPASDGVWEDKALPAGATGALVWARAAAPPADFGLRKDGSTAAPIADVSQRVSFATVEALAETIEVYTDLDLDPALHLLAYTVAPDSGAGQTRGLEIAVELDRPRGVSGFAGRTRDIDLAIEVRRLWGRSQSVGRTRGSAVAIEVGRGSGRGGKISEDERILALIVRPYDESIAQTARGLPIPFAHAPLAAGPEVTVSGALTAVYASDTGFISEPGDDPANAVFEGRLQEPYDFQARLFERGEPAGRSSVSAGTIRLINSDGAFDDRLGLGWAGRQVELYRGRRGASFASFQEVFRGTLEDIDWTARAISIRLRDRQDVFRQPLQAGLYGGTGGLDGGEDLAGKPRPQAYGRCGNVAPTLVDPANQVYQFHDRRAEAVLAVRDQGAALTAGDDHADYQALVGATIAAGSYHTCLALGLIRLSPASAPVGLVTADVLGDAEGGFVASTADIVRRIVTTRPLIGRIEDPGGLEVASFEVLNAAQPATVQYYASSEEQPEIAEVLDRLMAGIGGYWFFTRRDRLRVGRLEAPRGGGAALTKREIAISVEVTRRTLQRPSRARRVAWAPLWSVQGRDNLAAALTEEEKEFYSTVARFAAASDDSVLTKHRLALDVETPGLFAFRADAEAEAERLLALHGRPRDVYTLPVVDALFAHQIGEEITWTFDRFGLDAGKDFVVIGVTENAAGNTTILDLWG